MKIRVTAILLLLAGMFFSQAAQANPFGLELGTKFRGLENKSGLLSRLQEYRALPKDGSLSKIRMEYGLFGKSNRLTFVGANLGEDDVDAILYVGYRDYVTMDGSYVKTQHLLDLASDYYTQRNAENYRITILPLSKIRAVIRTGEEDKMGLTSGSRLVDHRVGQKTETLSGEILGTFGDHILAVSMGNQEFSEAEVSHDMDSKSATWNWRPNHKAFGLAFYEKQEYDPARYNNGQTLEIEAIDIAGGLELTDSLSVAASFANLERDNKTPWTRSFEDDAYNVSMDYASRIGKASISYDNADRDYLNADITNRETETVKLKGSTVFNFIKLKADYSHGYRDVTEAAGASITSFDEMSGEFHKKRLSAQLIGFKKFGLTWTLNRQAKQYTPTSTYGTTSYTTLNDGFSAYYLADETFTLTASHYLLEARTQGRYRFRRLDANTIFDTDVMGGAFRIYDDTEYFQFGSVWNYTSDTDITADLSIANSELSNPLANNLIHEKTFKLAVDHEICPNHQISASYTWSKYDNLIDSSFREGDNLFEVELTRIF